MINRDIEFPKSPMNPQNPNLEYSVVKEHQTAAYIPTTTISGNSTNRYLEPGVNMQSSNYSSQNMPQNTTSLMPGIIKEYAVHAPTFHPYHYQISSQNSVQTPPQNSCKLFFRSHCLKRF